MMDENALFNHGESAGELACVQFPEAWFPHETENGGKTYPLGVRVPKELCRQCPVRALCLELAQQFESGLLIADRFGIWGGLTPTERYYASEDRKPGSKPWVAERHRRNRLTLSSGAA